MLDEFKLIVAGGRDFNDPELLSRVLFAMSDNEFADVDKLSIVSGMARGADALGYMFARQYGVQVYEFHANWNKYGKGAGFRRNEDMGRFADGALCFHDGSSRGTKHMIDFMRNQNKPVTVVDYAGVKQ